MAGRLKLLVKCCVQPGFCLNYVELFLGVENCAHISEKVIIDLL